MSFLKDGYQTLIGFDSAPGIALYANIKEKTVTPPGVDNTGSIDITTMRNAQWRTKFPKQLMTLTAMTFTVSYDPGFYASIVAMTGQIDVITVYFPDGSTLAFYGFVDKIIPGENKEGEFPTATMTIEPTNMDETDAEVGPDFTPP